MNRFYESQDIVEDYMKFRPQYDLEIASKIMDSVKKNIQKNADSNNKPVFMIDVGCGAGQSTVMFPQHFEQILGVDPSPNQIKAANRNNTFKNIRFEEGIAEKLPVHDCSVDLILSGTAAHWFNIPEFLKEAERVLKPGGCLALFGYWIPRLTKVAGSYLTPMQKRESVNIMEKYLIEAAIKVNQYEQTAVARREYKDIFEAIPYQNKRRLNDHGQHYEWNLYQFLEFFKSVDFFNMFPEYMEKLENDIRKLLGLESVNSKEIDVELTFSIFTYIAFKEQ